MAQRAIEREDTASASTRASARVEVCSAIAVAVHELLSAVKTVHNDTLGINRFPPEVLGAIFFQLTVNDIRPLRNVCLASAVCRRWRDVTLSTPQLWTRIEDPGQDLLPHELLRSWLERSGALPISVVCAGGTDCILLNDHMSRIRRLVLTKWWTGWEYHLMQMIQLSAPVLETLWMPEYITLSSDIFRSYAPKLRTLAVRLDMFDVTNSYSALRGITRLHLLSHPDDGQYSPEPLQRDIILHVLSELPNLAILVGVAPMNSLTASMSSQELMDLRHHGLRVVQATDSPLSGEGMMESLHTLRYDRIRDVFISRPSSFTMESLFSDEWHDPAYTHVTLDRIHGQVVLRTQDGFTRALTECKALRRSTSNLHHLATSLMSLTVAGRLYQDARFLPAFPVLRTLTFAVHSSDFPPSAMRLNWSCPCLKTLCLTSIRDRESISSGAVETFISTHLDFADERLAELRLDSVEVTSDTDGRADTTDHVTALSLLVEKFTSTSAILEPIKVERYGP
ncbi:hypothetical protein EXIGLDRAFT_730286 [Exidia glandulosa HHB12029]|uniref:F-box domain-containing protein n=1 Tax=Exidia glandulosa HHB12029 TaxID=1314781 RepID=A0A166B3N4_EXIGL|nr:hypothetical protein EXIGLDRAFT_730286 [Exidia glandulosa HHB12029]